MNYHELVKPVNTSVYVRLKGVKHNPTIIKWLDDMGKYGTENKAWWRDDETSWCGLFVGHCLGEAGRYVVKNWFRAREWDNAQLMTKLDKPAYGCIVTFTRRVEVMLVLL